MRPFAARCRDKPAVTECNAIFVQQDEQRFGFDAMEGDGSRAVASDQWHVASWKTTGAAFCGRSTPKGSGQWSVEPAKTNQTVAVNRQVSDANALSLQRHAIIQHRGMLHLGCDDVPLAGARWHRQPDRSRACEYGQSLRDTRRGAGEARDRAPADNSCRGA